MNERRYCARTTIDYFSSLSAKRFIDRETIGCREKRSPRGLKNIKREKLIEAKREKQNKLFFFDSIKRLALLEWSSNWPRASWRRRERVRVTFLRFKISSLRSDDERRVKFSRIFTIRPRKKANEVEKMRFSSDFSFHAFMLIVVFLPLLTLMMRISDFGRSGGKKSQTRKTDDFLCRKNSRWDEIVGK